jgi:hypothetical protein
MEILHVTTRNLSGRLVTTALRAVVLTALLSGCGTNRETESPAAARPSSVARVPAAAPSRDAASTAAARDAAPATSPASTAGNLPAADAGGVVYAARAGIEPGRPTTLREAYPDYHPGANDPELESTRTGRRTVPRHDRGFDNGGAASLQDLVTAIVSGIDRGDGEALDRTAVTFHDFDGILWPEMPQSRPAANVPVGEAWDFLRRRHLSAFNRTSGDLAGTGLVLQGIEVGKVVEYTNFRLHDDIRVTVLDANGDALFFPMIRTVAECRGRFKLYSTRD